jgi:DNA-binding HxlR family transcriptional regulator
MSRNEESKPCKTAPYAYEGLERIFHEKARLGIITCLVRHPEGLVFPELKSLCDLTDGNLNRHLHQLEESEVIVLEKRFEGKRPQTLCKITKSGQKRFAVYLDQLQRALEDARASPSTSASINASKNMIGKGRLRPSPEGS